MAQAFVVGGGGGGVGSDELSAVANNVLAGNTYVGADTDDDVGVGTLALTGNAVASDVANGKTFYSNDAHAKQTGTLALTGNAAVGSVLSGSTFYSNSFSQQTGTMPNHGNWVGSVGRNTSTYIPAGYHAGGGYVTGPAMTDRGATTYYAKTAAQTIIPAGVYTTANQTLAAITSSNFAAGHIANGVTISVGNSAQNILSATGTYKGWGTATANQVLSGATFSTASLASATGTIPSKGGQSVTPSTSAQTVATSGYYMTGNVTVGAIPSTYKQVGSTTSFFDLGGMRVLHMDEPDIVSQPMITNVISRSVGTYAKGATVQNSASGYSSVQVGVLFRPIKVSDIHTTGQNFEVNCNFSWTSSGGPNASFVCLDSSGNIYYAISLLYDSNKFTSFSIDFLDKSILPHVTWLCLYIWCESGGGGVARLTINDATIKIV